MNNKYNLFLENLNKNEEINQRIETIKKHEEILVNQLNSINCKSDNKKTDEIIMCLITRVNNGVKSINLLRDNNCYFDTNIILSHIYESIALIIYIIENPETRAKNYNDFMFVEMLENTIPSKEIKDFIIKNLKDNERFLTKKAKKLPTLSDEERINKSNYIINWYQNEGIKSISDIFTKTTTNLINLDELKKYYGFLCKYKHLSPRLILTRNNINLIIDKLHSYKLSVYALSSLLLLTKEINTNYNEKIITKTIYNVYNYIENSKLDEYKIIKETYNNKK